MTFLAIYYCIGLLINKETETVLFPILLLIEFLYVYSKKVEWNQSNPPPLYPPLKKYFVVTYYYFTGNQVASHKADEGLQRVFRDPGFGLFQSRDSGF